MIKTLYVIEYGNIIVTNWELGCDAIYYSLFEARQMKHKLYHFYKEHFKEMKKIKFKDFKIVEYVAKENLK